METKNLPQVTIFSISTCPHCKKAKSLLNDKDIPYVDISLTSYPSKRSDMIGLADRLTVPQIFIHNKHIGGGSDLLDLEEQGKLDQLLKDEAANATPLDSRLSIPDIPPVEPFNVDILNNPGDHEIIEIAGKNYTHWEIRDIIIKEADIQDRKYHLRTYKKCFVGSEFVAFLLKKFELKSKQDAIQLGKQLQERNFFHHVVREHNFKDEYLFYRLHGDEEETVLNRFKTYPSGQKLSICPFNLVQGIKTKFEKIKDNYTEKDGMVAYFKMPKHLDWNNFLESFSDLQLVDMYSMTEDQKLAFIVNVYNLTIKIAFAIIGDPRTGLQRYRFFDSYKIDIGGNLFSFNELESGILRGNRKSPGHFSKHFSDSDVREKLSLSNVDNRIHFALNCGAKSCPPVKKFTPEAVREEFRINSQAFCEDDGNVKIDLQKKQIWLSRIFDWYSGDFGKNDKERISTILEFLRGEKKQQLQTLIDGGKVSIKLLPYDWSNDALPQPK